MPSSLQPSKTKTKVAGGILLQHRARHYTAAHTINTHQQLRREVLEQ